jgi:GNAT superfamily N-acetyltransferase/RimJ/RimL family protein N-acetyltransferase
MRIDQFTARAEPGPLAACYGMYQAAVRADDPDAPPIGREDFEGWWSGVYSGDPVQAYLAADATGPVGCCLLRLPTKQNTHTVTCLPVVPPAHRRHGVGTALLARAGQEARAAGRSVLTGEALEESPGSRFALARGAVAGIGDIRRGLDLDACPPDRRSALRAAAQPLAAGYDLVSWCGPTPERYLGPAAAVSAAMADAPHNPGTEAEIWDADRIRAMEQACLDRGIDLFTVAAIHAGTGDMAALTQVAADQAGAPGWADQLLTSVTRPHRGHRLGLLVKLAMLDLLSAEAPPVRTITTSNAEPNQYMIAINEQLGFRVTGRFSTWELNLAAEPR